MNVGIIGAGTMGSGIAQLAAEHGCTVLLYDAMPDILSKAVNRISVLLQKSVDKGERMPADRDAILSRINIRNALEDLAPSDIIIEAIVENLPHKQEIFQRLELVTEPNTVFASNTSSLSITAIASKNQFPQRVIGLHFFNPPQKMKLVEIVKGHRTSQETIDATNNFARTLNKTAIIVNDTPGFIVNRIARPFYGEALRILGEGVASVEEIDRIVRLEGGFMMGPFELIDLIGVDINYAVTQSLFEQTFGEARYKPHTIQRTMVSAGLLGRKTKRGFYTYDT